MKNILRVMIAALLARQVRRLRRSHRFELVAVVGSIGKTSTKFAVARILSAKFRVRFQEGNYNTPLTVPLALFGLSLPSLLNPLAWAVIFLKTERVIRGKFPYEVVVVELGTDGPGQLIEFQKILRADIGILTAISPEHMELFKTLDAVAAEELTIEKLSKKLLLNADLCPENYRQKVKSAISYGEKSGLYKIHEPKISSNGSDFIISKGGEKLARVEHASVSLPQLYSICAGVAVADILGMNAEEIRDGVGRVQQVPGRMQLLKGINGATIIDETYNASPDAMIAALKVLYSFPAKQRIALLGNMNEMGDYSKQAHTDVGSFCDPRELSLRHNARPRRQ